MLLTPKFLEVVYGDNLHCIIASTIDDILQIKYHQFQVEQLYFMMDGQIGKSGF